MAGRLVIRADAGPAIGIGHVMRCLALARAWREAGGEATLVGRSPTGDLRERIRAAGIDYRPLGQTHPDPSDLAMTRDVVQAAVAEQGGAGGAWLAVDGYHFDARYYQALRETGCRVLVVDDMAHLPYYDADLILNQNLGAEELDYPSGGRTVLLRGVRYVLLRPEFQRYREVGRDVARTAKRVLVTLGGADPRNVTEQAVRALEQVELPGLEAKIVAGAANPRAGRLREEIGRGRADVELLTRVDDVPWLMAWADVALSAAGSTCWELAFMGLPAAVVVAADNQVPIARRLAEEGVVDHLGDWEDLTAERIAGRLASLCRDQARRREMSRCGRRMVDGLGAQRVVAAMRDLDGVR